MASDRGAFVDLRADIGCNLGEVISAEINDDYVQGVGLIKYSGSCVINGIITPAVGTLVDFSYTRPGGSPVAIPRRLRVLSFFADPYRRTTTVQLGCKLTYLSDLKPKAEERIVKPKDDSQNDDYSEDDFEVITRPISASFAMSRCLSILQITASSIPLTNQFSVPKFDFSAGFVNVLSDLLVSENFCGYLDFNEVLQIINLDSDGGAGPVVVREDTVDVGDLNFGQLPGDAVTVAYDSLVLVPPEDEELTGLSVVIKETQTTAGAEFSDSNRLTGDYSQFKVGKFVSITGGGDNDGQYVLIKANGNRLRVENLDGTATNWPSPGVFTSVTVAWYKAKEEVLGADGEPIDQTLKNTVNSVQVDNVTFQYPSTITPGDFSSFEYGDLVSVSGGGENDGDYSVVRATGTELQLKNIDGTALFWPDRDLIADITVSYTAEQEEANKFANAETQALAYGYGGTRQNFLDSPRKDEPIAINIPFKPYAGLNIKNNQDGSQTITELEGFLDFATGSSEITSFSKSTNTTVAGKTVVKETIKEVKEPDINAAGSLVQATLKYKGEWNTTTVEKRVTETYDYDSFGRVISKDVQSKISNVYLLGSLGLPMSFNTVIDGELFFDPVPLPPGTHLAERVLEKYRYSTGKRVTETKVFGPWYKSVPGQQALAEMRAIDEEGNITLQNVIDVINSQAKTDARNAALIGYSIKIEPYNRSGTENEAPTQDQAVLEKYTDGLSDAELAEGIASDLEQPLDVPDPDNGYRTSSESNLQFVLGPETALRRVQFDLPYADDNRFYATGTGEDRKYFVTKGDAKRKARRFGKVQNRLLLGNRFGLSLQTAIYKIPLRPYSNFYYRANGLTAEYKTNGTAITMSKDGIVVSTDALFWAAVSGTGDFWFPVAPGVTTLATEPPVTQAELIVTEPAAGSEDIAITLNGVTYNVTLTGGGTAADDAAEIAAQSFTDYDVVADGDTVIFTYTGSTDGVVGSFEVENNTVGGGFTSNDIQAEVEVSEEVLPYNEILPISASVRVSITAVSIGYADYGRALRVARPGACGTDAVPHRGAHHRGPPGHDLRHPCQSRG